MSSVQMALLGLVVALGAALLWVNGRGAARQQAEREQAQARERAEKRRRQARMEALEEQIHGLRPQSADQAQLLAEIDEAGLGYAELRQLQSMCHVQPSLRDALLRRMTELSDEGRGAA
jgi:type II secretory pathway pseudopilin PulG